MPLTFTNAITWCSKPNVFSRDHNYTIMESSIVWFTSNNPTTTWSILGTLVSFIKLIIVTNVCNSPCDIHLSKIENVFVKNEKLANNSYPMSSWPWQKIFLPKENNEEKIKYEGIGVTLTSKTKCSYKWVRRPCNPCKCKIPKFQKTFIVGNHF